VDDRASPFVAARRVATIGTVFMSDEPAQQATRTPREALVSGRPPRPTRGQYSATIPPARREEVLANDFRALAAAQQDRPSLEGMLPTMTMPCCLYAGDADALYPKVRECAQHIPRRSRAPWRVLTTRPAFEKLDLHCCTSPRAYVPSARDGLTPRAVECWDGGMAERYVTPRGPRTPASTPIGNDRRRVKGL
jgi:hypothetical protein